MKKSIDRWIAVRFLIILILTTAISTVWNFYSTRQAIIAQEERDVSYCAAIISGMLDQYGLDRLKEESDSNLYAHVRRSFRRLCISFDLMYLYVYTTEPRSGLHTFIASVASEEEEDQRLQTEMPPGRSKLMFTDESGVSIPLGTDRMVRSEGRIKGAAGSSSGSSPIIATMLWMTRPFAWSIVLTLNRARSSMIF